MAEKPESLAPAATPRPERARVLLVDGTPANLEASRAILAKLTSLLAGLPASHRWPEHIALTLRVISCELPGNRGPEMPSP